MRSLIEDEAKREIGVVENAHALLREVYRNPALDLPIRMRAAALAIAYEMPKLAVVAQVSESDFASLLDRRIENLKRIEENRANGKMLDGTSVNGGEADARLPPRLPDRPFRRI